jgi:hypothetical protein
MVLKKIEMKKVLLSIVISVVYVIACQCQVNTLIGNWTGKDENRNTGSIVFYDDGTAKLTIRGQVIASGEYRIDDSKDPIWLDFIIKRDEKEKIIHCLMQFVDRDEIRVEVFPNAHNSRPENFSGNNQGSSIILKKQQP